MVVFVAEVPDGARCCDIAFAAGIDGPEVALSLPVFGILSDGDIDFAFVENRR